MSGQAVGWVLRYGPADQETTLLVTAVANRCDPTGRDGDIGLRQMAVHARLSLHRARVVLAAALEAGWLTLDRAGGPRRRARYHLGPLIYARIEGELPREPDPPPKPVTREPERQIAQPAPVGARIPYSPPRAARGTPTWNRADTRDRERQIARERPTVFGRSSGEAALTADPPPLRARIDKPAAQPLAFRTKRKPKPAGAAWAPVFGPLPDHIAALEDKPPPVDPDTLDRLPPALLERYQRAADRGTP